MGMVLVQMDSHICEFHDMHHLANHAELGDRGAVVRPEETHADQLGVKVVIERSQIAALSQVADRNQPGGRCLDIMFVHVRRWWKPTAPQRGEKAPPRPAWTALRAFLLVLI